MIRRVSMLFFILIFAGIATAQCAIPPSGMISWWRAEGDATDFVDSNDGTLQNGATFATGMVGQAFSFDGVDDYVSIPDAANLDITGDFTLDAWIFPEVGSGVRIIDKSKHDIWANTVYNLNLNVDGTITLVVANNGASPGDILTSTSPVTFGAWNHVAGVYKSGNFLKVYINGAEVGSLATTGTTINTNNFPLLIGSSNSFDPDDFFEGRIDEVEIFNAALSESEIQSIYNAGSAGKCTTVPEFSNLTLLLAVLAVLAGIFVMRSVARD